jgi:hypothetical protein
MFNHNGKGPEKGYIYLVIFIFFEKNIIFEKFTMHVLTMISLLIEKLLSIKEFLHDR